MRAWGRATLAIVAVAMLLLTVTGVTAGVAPNRTLDPFDLVEQSPVYQQLLPRITDQWMHEHEGALVSFAFSYTTHPDVVCGEEPKEI